MASENVELVRRLIDAFAAGQREELLPLLHPDVVISEWPEAPDTKTLRGHPGVLEVVRSWDDTWAWVRTEVDEFVEAGNFVVTYGRTRGKGRGSEVEVEIDAFTVYEVRDGKVARMEFFTSKEPALRVAGIDESEDAA